MLKKRQLTNRYGWEEIRTIKYKGIGTVYGVPYHQVFPIVPPDEWTDMMNWCRNTLGNSGTEDKPGVWLNEQRWYANNQMLWFKDIKDCEWFLLRWQ